jgi:putative pyruvate formate lyase activating enzyme
MNCCYCQNFQISQQGSIKYTKEVTDAQLADIMIDLMKSGCHNINLVSPTIWVANIVPAIHLAKNMGLDIPIVYNCGGYENVQTIKMLEGIIDVYMPDMRYADNNAAFAFSNVKDYVENNRKSVIEMFRQVNTLKIGPDGAATKGLLIRLLVLPNNMSNYKRQYLVYCK